MIKMILKSLSIVVLVTSTVFADDALSPFNEQDDLNYPQPNGKESYLATRAPMTSERRGYFGLNLGGSFNYLKPELSSLATNTTNIINDHKTTYNLGLYGGLGTNYKNFYIGTELSGGYDSFKDNITSSLNGVAVNIFVKRPFFAGLDLTPGYLSSQKDCLFYGRIGIGANLFKLTPNGDNNATNQALIFSLRTGVGMEYFINETFSMRIDCLLNTYSNVTKTYTSYNYKIPSSKALIVNLGLTINL